MRHQQKRDLIIAPVCEGALILLASLAAWVCRQPLIFTSLGPTAFELIETPHRRSAKPYNVLVGHLVGVVAGFAALLITQAWKVPAVSTRHIQLPRVEAAVLSATFTVVGTLLMRATQPAALSTTLLISLGTMQRWQDILIIMGAVLLMLVAGEPLRRWRDREMTERGEPKST